MPAARLVELIEAFGSELRTRHGATRVLAAAARVIRERAVLADLIERAPRAGRKDPGVSDLERALAGCHLARWRAERRTATDCTAVTLASSPYKSTLDSRARLIALAEVVLAASPETADAVLDELLGHADLHLLSDVVEHVLRPVIQGGARAAVPGVEDRQATPVVTGRVRDRALRELSALAGTKPDDIGHRSLPMLFRDAFDYSQLPPDVAAGLFSADLAPTVAESAWLDPDRLAALVVPAALGRHPSARTALDRWCRVRRPAQPANPRDRKQRQVICGRLRMRARESVHVLDYLILVAQHTTDLSYLVDPVEQLAGSHADELASRHRDLLGIVEAGRESPSIETRADAYRMLAALTDAYSDAPDAAALSRHLAAERAPVVINAILDVIDASLRRGAANWTATPGTYDTLVAALAVHTDRRPGTGNLTERAMTSQHTLRCRIAPLSTAAEREAVLRPVGQLLAARDRTALRPLGYLMARLTKENPADAARLLVDASNCVAAIGAPAASWKTRVAKRWRTPLSDVIGVLRRSAWRALMRELTGGDQFILMEAIDVSLWIRTGSPEDDLASTLNEGAVSDRVQRAFAIARQRHHRVVGGACGCRNHGAVMRPAHIRG